MLKTSTATTSSTKQDIDLIAIFGLSLSSRFRQLPGDVGLPGGIRVDRAKPLSICRVGRVWLNERSRNGEESFWRELTPGKTRNSVLQLQTDRLIVGAGDSGVLSTTRVGDGARKLFTIQVIDQLLFPNGQPLRFSLGRSLHFLLSQLTWRLCWYGRLCRRFFFSKNRVGNRTAPHFQLLLIRRRSARILFPGQIQSTIVQIFLSQWFQLRDPGKFSRRLRFQKLVEQLRCVRD